MENEAYIRKTEKKMEKKIEEEEEDGWVVTDLEACENQKGFKEREEKRFLTVRNCVQSGGAGLGSFVDVFGVRLGSQLSPY